MTPTGGKRRCCETAYNLHYQLCDAGTYSTGGGGCGVDWPCVDIYHNCGVDHNLNFITREHAIEYLTQFVNDVKALKAAFKQAYEDAEVRKNDPRFYELLYSWQDRVAKSTKEEVRSGKQKPGEQLVRHIVYVKMDKASFNSYTDGVKDSEYKLPYVHNYREWTPIAVAPYVLPKKCMMVSSANGSFVVTVARYDEDVGTASRSPLKNFWVFKSRQNPVGAYSTIPADILNRIQNPRQCASTYPPINPAPVIINATSTPINNATSTPPISNVTPTNAFCVDAEVAKFVLDNGVVSETEGHYGPGWTYKKNEMNWDTNVTTAAQRNKDIYIKRLR